MAAASTKPQRKCTSKGVVIPFASTADVWAFYKSASSKYRINPFYAPSREIVDNILENFKSKFLAVSTTEGVLEDMLRFFNDEVLNGDFEDFTTDSDGSGGMDQATSDDSYSHDDINKENETIQHEVADETMETETWNLLTTTEGEDDVPNEPNSNNDIKECNESIRYKCASDTISAETETQQTTSEELEKIKQLFLAADENTICKIPFAALENERTDIIDKCPKSGVDLNLFRSPSGHTLLMKCVSLEIVDLKILDYLLKDKIHVNVNVDESLRNRTALFVCLVNRKIQPSHKLCVVRKLLQAGSTLTTRGRFHSTVLHAFVSTLLSPVDAMLNANWKDIIEELLKAGLDVNSKDHCDSTPLMSAIGLVAPDGELPKGLEPKQISYDVVEYLLKRGADPDIKDGDGRTSLYHAALSQNLTLLNILVKYSKNPDAQDNMGMNCIYGICAYSQWTTECEEIDTILFPILHILADAGCCLNTQAIDKSTVLHHAAATQSHLVCEKLCSLGADTNRTDYLQRTPLHLTIRNAVTEVVDVLLKYGACVNAKAKHGETPLHQACLLKNLNAAKILIAAKADIEVETVLGVRPIHLAAENGDVDFIQYMAQLSNINATDIYGANAIHYAAADGNIETLEYLLNVDCKKDKKDENQNTPLDLALYMGHQKASEQLCVPNVPRFGNLPSLCFPNRPLIEEDEVEQFYNELADKYKRENKTPAKIANDILISKGLGTVDLESDEGKLISDLIIKYVECIAARVGELDPLFSCLLLRAGSTYEGVKTGYPDEFDFLCSLTVLAEHVETIEHGGTEGFVFVVLKTSAPTKLLRFCPRSDRRISASHILRYFSKLSRIATYGILNENEFDGHLYTGYMLLPESGPLFTGNNYPLSKLNAQTVSFRGRLHKLLDISIDLNPVIFHTSYPAEAVQRCNIVQDVTTRGIYCLPKLCGQVPGLYEDGRAVSEHLWRLSTQHIEAEAMRSMSQLARDCYVMCKVLRMEPLTCSVKYLNPQDLIEDDLMKMMPSGTAWSDDTDSDECCSEEAGPGDVDDACDTTMETHMHLHTNEALDEDSNEDRATLDVVYCGDGFRYAEDELTAEKLIPSYYIKSIFIKEMDKLIREGNVLSERSLLEIPRNVYEVLLKALEEKNLTTLFMPKHNMLRTSVNHTTSELETRLRETYCRKIIWLMDQLNF